MRRKVFKINSFLPLPLVVFFNFCVPEGPHDEAPPDTSLLVTWRINGNLPDKDICGAIAGQEGQVFVEVWEDSDMDGNLNDGFYIYRFGCDGGLCLGSDKAGQYCTDDEQCMVDGQGRCVRGAGKTPGYFFSGVETGVSVVLVLRPDGERQQEILSFTTDGDYFTSDGIGWKKITPRSSDVCTLSDENRSVASVFSACYPLGEFNFEVDLPQGE